VNGAVLLDLIENGRADLRTPERSEASSPVPGAGRAICPTCGARAAGRHRFCARCGRALGAVLRPPAEGTVTIVFTDIKDYSGLLHRYTGAEIQRIMAAHNEIVRQQVYETGGFEVKFLGDGFMLAFPSARGAIRCAIGIQRDIVERNALGDSPEIMVRVGLNSGDAVREDEDFFGLAVSLAARVMERAEGGEILATELTRGLAGSWTGVRFADRGRQPLKGFGRRRLFEVLWQDEAVAMAAGAS
jgi:adenylate cyclase